MIHYFSAALLGVMLARSDMLLALPADGTPSPQVQQAGSIDYAVRRPPTPDPYAQCMCKDVAKDDIVRSFIGVVVDAQLFLGTDGKSVTDRQATIFRIIDGEKSETVKVFHPTEPARCGLQFDYGKEYKINVRKNAKVIETDYCISSDRPHDYHAD